MSNTDDLSEMCEQVATRQDLARFVMDLRSNYLKDQDSWENKDIPTFLSAMAGWIEDMDGYYQNKGQEFTEDQPWDVFARILTAATIYS